MDVLSNALKFSVRTAKAVLICAGLFISQATLADLQKVEEFDYNTFKDRLAPRPQAFEFYKGFYNIGKTCTVEVSVAAPDDKIESEVADKLKRFWKTKASVSVKTDPSLKNIKPEGYKIEVSQSGIKISALDIKGIRQSLKTLRQLADPKPLGETLQGYILPFCKIDDWPMLARRMLEMAYKRGQSRNKMEQLIRLAAYYKFNAIDLSIRSVFKSKKHPEFCWEDSGVDEGDIKHLIKVANEEHILIFPHYQVLGHANNASVRGGKHCALDYHPELQPYFEPLGYSWCMSNPATRKVVGDMVLELHDLFGRPPYFEIGLDEVFDLATCAECRKRPADELMLEYITYFRDLFAKRNTRIIIWHDMLIDKTDPRWKGYEANARKIYNTAELYKKLPKDIIICDWQYGFHRDQGKDKDPSWPTMKFFRDAGFDVMGAPWTNANGAYSMGKMLAEEKMFGMLATTWGKHTGLGLTNILLQSSAAAWGSPIKDYPEIKNNEERIAQIVRRLNFCRHVRHVNWDIGVDKIEDTGIHSEKFQEAPLY